MRFLTDWMGHLNNSLIIINMPAVLKQMLGNKIALMQVCF